MTKSENKERQKSEYQVEKIAIVALSGITVVKIMSLAYSLKCGSLGSGLAKL